MADRKAGKKVVWEDDDAKQAPQSLMAPFPNWEDNVAAHDEKRSASSEPREELQIPSLSSSGYGGKPCKCRTLEAYHYGAICRFHHDEQSSPRESVAITISPIVGEQPSPRESVPVTVSPTVGGGGGYANSGRQPDWKPSKWRTRICRNWEMTGDCRHGTKCPFAHGVEELQGVVSSRTSTDNACRMEWMPLGIAWQIWGTQLLPPNWQEIVAAHDEKRSASSEPREEHQIPSLSSSGYGGKPCKCHTLEAYHYGAVCPVHHDAQSSPHESVAITISPTVGGGGGYGNSHDEQSIPHEHVARTISPTVGGGGGYGNSGRQPNWKASNLRTRIEDLKPEK